MTNKIRREITPAPPPSTMSAVFERFQRYSALTGKLVRARREGSWSFPTPAFCGYEHSSFSDGDTSMNLHQDENDFLIGNHKFCQFIDTLLPEGGLIKVTLRIDWHAHHHFLGRFGEGEEKVYVLYRHDNEIYTEQDSDGKDTKDSPNSNVLKNLLTEEVMSFSGLGFLTERTTYSEGTDNIQWDLVPESADDLANVSHRFILTKNKTGKMQSDFYYNFVNDFTVEDWDDYDPRIGAMITLDGVTVETFNVAMVLRAIQDVIGKRLPQGMVNVMNQHQDVQAATAAALAR
jgi:hypothetical protein